MDTPEQKIYNAWRHVQADGKSKFINIPGSHVVDSAKRAVQAAIFMDQQPLDKPDDFTKADAA